MPRLEKVPAPERALELAVSRAMDLETGLETLPAWERWLFDVASGGSSSLPEAISWYEELASVSRKPLVHVYLAILEGEAGLVDKVRNTTEGWRSRADPFPIFSRFIQAAYLDSTLDPSSELALQAELAEALPAGWFYDRLAISLATKANNVPLLTATREAATLRAAPLLRSSRTFLSVELGIIMIGLAAIVFLLVEPRGGRRWLMVGGSSMPPVWSGRVGAIVLLRGGAAAVVVLVALLTIGGNSTLFMGMALPLLYLPFLWLTSRHLLRPTGMGFGQGFGLRLVPGGWAGLVLAVLMLVTIQLLLEWGLSVGAGALNFSIHWTEWFDPDLAWGSGSRLGIALMEFLVFAPVFEEIVFRGVLFGSLRRKFGFGVSAVLSASVFAVAHGYGVLGFVSVLLSGVIWAWGYEKTGSLLPGMVAHVTNNLLVCSAVMLILRS